MLGTRITTGEESSLGQKIRDESPRNKNEMSCNCKGHQKLLSKPTRLVGGSNFKSQLFFPPSNHERTFFLVIFMEAINLFRNEWYFKIVSATDRQRVVDLDLGLDLFQWSQWAGPWLPIQCTEICGPSKKRVNKLESYVIVQYEKPL